MRKALLLSALGALAAASLGCALTDYSNAPIEPRLNKSHGVIGCLSDDRMANTQQTLEPSFRDLLYTVGTDGVAGNGGRGNTNCPGFGPAVSPDTFVSRKDAREWGRFIGPYHFNTEAQVFGTGLQAGTWAMAGMLDLDDGARRLNTYYSQNTGSFSCVGAATGGRDGGPEGVVYSAALDGTIPGWHVETVAIDDNSGSQFCGNIAATTAGRAGSGYSTFAGFLGRGGEGRLIATPITRREGLEEILAGRATTVTVADGDLEVDFTGRLNLLEDGRVEASLLGISANGMSYGAESPVRFVVDPSNQFRTIEVHPSTEEMVQLAQFAIDADLVDRDISLGQFIPKLGIQLPEQQVYIVGETLRRFVEDNTPGSADDPGFGG